MLETVISSLDRRFRSLTQRPSDSATDSVRRPVTAAATRVLGASHDRCLPLLPGIRIAEAYKKKSRTHNSPGSGQRGLCAVRDFPIASLR